MDDDIDIDEHDILDNPIVKSIFPDISVIKKEISQYYEDEPIIKRVIKEETEVSETRYQQLSEDLQADLSDSDFQKDTEEKPQLLTEHTQPVQCNKILLGSKPNVVIQEDNIKSNLNSKPDEVTHQYNKELLLGSKNNVSTQNDSIKLFLGSRSNTDSQKTAEYKQNKTNQVEKVKFKQIQLILQDVNSYLNQNGRYCKLCCRLFLSKKAHEVHKYKVHHNKIHKNKNSTKKINKCTKETQHRCNICGSIFANNSNLCRHYRNVHNKKSMKRITSVKTRTNTEIKKSNTTVTNYKINNEKITNKQIIQSNNKCNMCNNSYKTFYSLKRHYIHKHKNKINVVENYAEDLAPDTYLTKQQEIVTNHDIDTEAPANKKRKHAETNKVGSSKYPEIETDPTQENHNVSTFNKTRKTKFSACKNDTSDKEKLKATSSKDNFDNDSDKEKRKVMVKSVVKDKEIEENLNTILTKENHKVAIEEDHKSKDVTCSENSLSKDTNTCRHCNKVFADKQLLIDHMYEILETKTKSGALHKNAESDINKNEDDKILFVCRQCSYYLPSIDAYFKHMIRNHKTEKFLVVIKEKFQSQCKYCPYKSSSITTHNTHIHSYHMYLMFLRIENEIDNDVKNQSKNFDKKLFSELNSFALESVLFECQKCSVYFLSANIAKDHKQHIELLINWKCSVCHRILKERDKEMHLKQHKCSKSLKVLDLNETALSYVLYNCTKCAIHFTEKRYQEHFPNCETETTDSTYCGICDILVDKMEINHHKTQHIHLRDGLDFTIIDANIIVDTVTSLTKKGMDTESEIRPRKRLNEQHNCLTYCYTCKCFLSDLGLKNKRHINGTCTEIFKYACNLCGLVLTNSVSMIHKERHERDKNLRLQDYKFFDFKGKQIRPPIPEYPDCKLCGIHFLNKNVIRTHLCDETDFLTCDICNIKLTETTFKLHMSFHFYVIQNTSFQNDSCIIPDQSSKDVSNSDHKTQHLSEKTTKAKGKTHHESDRSKRTTEHKPKSELLKTLLTSELSETPKPKLPETTSKPADERMLTNSLGRNNTRVVKKQLSVAQPNVDPLIVLFNCKTCGVAFESYDEVIKHCQTHFSDRENQITSVKKCKQCSLNFDSRFYMDHQRRIHSSVAKIQVLKFDPSYFTSKNMIWIQHIFQSLPEELVNELLEKCIYQHEHRIKLECTQNGSSHINVYKCCTCGNYIDPGCLYKHAQNCCSEARKYPCSFCGLPFISSFSRSSHEKLHSQIKGLTKKALNIILFNQSKDKTFNNRMFTTTNQFIFYQCRNCDGVVEKSMLTKHVCDRNTLIKCITCGLLLGKAVYKAHLSKHTDLENFHSENFKVILFGNENNKEVLKTLSPSFSGTVYDYSLYKCQICEICIRNNVYIEKHTCTPNFDLDRLMCFECDLYFPSISFKHHMIQHKTDPDFIKENMNVITFRDGKIINYSSSFAKNQDTATTKENTNEMYDLTTNNDTKITIDDGEEKIMYHSKEIRSDNEIKADADDKICISDGEESSDSNSISRKKENNIYDDKLKITNYKMDINTTSSNKNIADGIYDGKEQSIDADKDNSVDNDSRIICDNDTVKSINDGISNVVMEEPEAMYKCTCGLHFTNKLKVLEHVKNCQTKTKQYKEKCSKCHLLFNPSELFSHLVIHHKDKRQLHDFKVIEISIDDVMN